MSVDREDLRELARGLDMSQVVETSDLVRGPRRFHMESAIRDYVHTTPGLNLITIETEKRGFRETVRFTVKGSLEKVITFYEDLQSSTDAMNRRMGY